MEHPRDTLHKLPLDTLPLGTRGLSRHYLVKTHRMENMVEMFKGAQVGRGQVELTDLPALFPDGGADIERDVELLLKVCGLPSFDVYSLRTSLREIDVPVDDTESLRLTDAKRDELTERMKHFTRPLIAQVYGDSGSNVDDLDDLMGMLRAPDQEQAMANLQRMAERLDVRLAEIPRFLEDYGDIFLSLAYFRDIFDGLIPEVEAFANWITDLEGAWNVRNDRQSQRLLQQVKGDMRSVTESLVFRFEEFDRQTKDFWVDINATRFDQVRRAISGHHTAVGGILCGLTLKMDQWREEFGENADLGGPDRRLEFIRREIVPGLDNIRELTERAARVGGAA